MKFSRISITGLINNCSILDQNLQISEANSQNLQNEQNFLWLAGQSVLTKQTLSTFRILQDSENSENSANSDSDNSAPYLYSFGPSGVGT